MDDISRQQQRIIIGILVLLIAVGSIIYFIDLDADPPMYYTGYHQSLATDPPQYTYFARNGVLFDDPPEYDNVRWQSFRVSIVNGLAYVIFSLFGISRYNANLTGLLFMLGSIAIFCFTLRRHLTFPVILLAAFLLIFNKTLFVYGRLPYLENGMIFFIMLLFYIFLNYRHKPAGQIAIGILLALTAVSGKIFGPIMFVPIVTVLYFEKRRLISKSVTIITVSGAATVLIWVLLFYGGDFAEIFGYFSAQSVGLYGFPDALTSPITFIEKVISFGNDTRFYYHAPTLGLLTGLVLWMLVRFYRVEELKKNIPLIFMLIWFIASVLFFMLGNYRPLRYIYFLYFPMVGISLLVMTDTASKTVSAFNKSRFILLFLIFWILIDQAAYVLFSEGQFNARHGIIVWYSLPAAILLTVIVRLFRFGPERLFKRKILIVSIIVVGILLNFGQSKREWFKYRAFNLKEAGQDVGEILNNNAVICGPIAPALLYENDLRGMIYAIGISDTDPDYFKKYPVTHIAVDFRASGNIPEKYPELTDAAKCASYWIRDNKTVLVRINHLTGNPEAGKYKPTDFEIGRGFMDKQIYDSALFYIQRFAFDHPNNKTALMLMGELLPICRRVDQAQIALLRGIRLYPNDFMMYVILGAYYHRRFMISHEEAHLLLSKENYKKAVEKNPYHADEINRLIQKISER